MMKLLRKPTLAFLFITYIMASCFDPPEIPIEPKISLRSFAFKPIPGNNIQDSLIVELNFEDGDGDLGLSPLVASDSLPPFHELDFLMASGADTVRFDPNNNMLPPYSCRDYEIIRGDTFLVKRNEGRYNFHLEFYRKDGGKFEVFDFLAYNCTPGFSGRFFDINTSGKERPLKGVLRYGVPSAFRVLFRNDTLKFRAWIYDRNDQAGIGNPNKQPHKSNEIESREFTLSEFLGAI